MDTGRLGETPAGYWEASRRVRETFARHALADVLFWAFAADEIARMPEAELDSFLDRGILDLVPAAEPAWAPAMDALRGAPVAALRGDLAKAFARIRALAHDVATGEPTAMIPMTVRLYAPGPPDRDGRPRWALDGRLADGIIWMALKLFSEVPRSLIRPCGITGCKRIYVAAKNQKYCVNHQREAHRQAQRRAERAFRARQRTAKPTTKRRTR
jgi:hypothetical protein